MAKISVIGCEWVGLTVAAGMAHLGHEVVAFDVCERTLDDLLEETCALGEPRMSDLIEKYTRTRRLRFASGIQDAVAGAEILFVCEPALLPDNGPNVAVLDRSIEKMLGVIADDSVIVLASTVSVGTADRLRAQLAIGEGGSSGVAVVSCPVFMKQGSAIADFFRPDQVVLGAAEPVAAQRVAALFGCVADRLLFMSNRSAETVALASGAFEARAMSFVNSLAGLCEAVDADVNDVARALVGQSSAATAPRRGSARRGERTTSEVVALSEFASRRRASTARLDGAIESKHERVDRVVNEVLRQLGPLAVDAAGRRSATVGVWGLMCSLGSTDWHDSPAMAVVDRLLECGLGVQAFDPAVDGTLVAQSDIAVHSHPYAAAAGADVLLVLSDWEGFAELDFAHAAESMTRPRVVDARQTLLEGDSASMRPGVEVLR